jgi:hypothetical protein
MRVKISQFSWKNEKSTAAQPLELAVIFPSKLAKSELLDKDSR